MATKEDDDTKGVLSARQLFLRHVNNHQTSCLLPLLPMQNLSPMENCVVKGAMSGVMGAAAGVVFGLFFSGMETIGPPAASMHSSPIMTGTIREAFREVRARCASTARNFAYIGAIYSLSECLIQKEMAHHGMETAAMAGCVTGGILARGSGAQGIAMGCAGFAAFSTAIEYFIEHM